MQPDQLAQLQQFSAMLNNSPSNSIRRGGSQSQVQPAPPTMGLNRGLSEKFGDKLTESKRELELKEEVDLYEKFRMTTKKFLSTTALGRSYQFSLLCLSILSPFQFIYTTYIDGDSINGRQELEYLATIEIVLGSIFTFDWILSFLIADHKILFFQSFFSMVDLMTVIPIWVQQITPCVSYPDIKTSQDGIVYILCGLTTTRVLRALRIRKRLMLIEDEVDRCLGEITLTLVIMILFNSALILYLEVHLQPLPFHTWTYWCWITTATVGYGDISPSTTIGRFATMCMIAFAVVSIPKMTNELIDKMALQSFYARLHFTRKGVNNTHVVICGELKSASLGEFFAELFHEDHDSANLHAVILQPVPPSYDMIMLLRDPLYSLQITYLEGSALIEKDLSRAKVELALAVFIMTNKFSTNPDQEDSKTILQQFSIKRYLQVDPNANPLFCMQMIRPENKRHLIGGEKGDEFNDDNLVVCLNEIKLGVIAKAILFPGINTLIMNLLTSFADDDEDEAAGKIKSETENVDEDETGTWVGEYQRGCDWEIYSTTLADMFEGVQFAALSEVLYQKLGIVLFALQVEDLKKDKGNCRVFLNPAQFVIPENDGELDIVAFVLAKNKAQSDLSFSSGDSHGFLVSIGQLSSSATSYAARVLTHATSKIESTNSDINLDVPVKSLMKKKLAWQEIMKKFSAGSSRETDFSVAEEQQKIMDKYMQETYYIYQSDYPEINDCYIKTSLSEELPLIDNHLIVVGKSLSNIYDLLLPMRLRSNGELQYIVILYPYDFPVSIWQRINLFQGVFIVRGSALEESDIRRAGVFKAKNVVVLADSTIQESIKEMKQSANNEALIDADAIFCYQCVKRMNEKTDVVVEIVRTTNVGYLDPEGGLSGADVDYKFSPQFAAGILFTSSLLDTIVCQSFYNPQIIKVVNKFVGSKGKESFNPSKTKKIKTGALIQIPVPDGLESRTYGSLYKYLSQRDIIPLGLYRGVFPHMKLGPKANKMSYVFTNPAKDTELFSCDRIFVLSPNPVVAKGRTEGYYRLDDEVKLKEVQHLRKIHSKRNLVETTASIVEELRDQTTELQTTVGSHAKLIEDVKDEMNRKFHLVMTALVELNGGMSFKSVEKIDNSKLEEKKQLLESLLLKSKKL